MVGGAYPKSYSSIYLFSVELLGFQDYCGSNGRGSWGVVVVDVAVVVLQT